MSLRETNKLISEALNNMNVNLIKTDKQILNDKLDYVIETLNNKSLNNYNLYSKAFQECIEDVYPDKDWYEVVDIDIEEDLFNTSDPYKTKEHVLDCIKEKEMTIEDAIKEDYDARQYTNNLLYLVKSGLIDKDSLIFNLLHYLSEDNVKEFVIDYDYFNEDDLLQEDTVKKANGKWTNRGDDGEEHGEFKTKKEADAQRRAMYANGYKGESIKESKFDEPTSIGKGYAAPITTNLRRHRIKDDLEYINDENPDHSRVAKNDLVRAYNEILTEIEEVEEFDAYWMEHKKALMSELKAQLDLIPADIRD